MKTITKETTVYKFSELNEEAKEKAIENLYDINVDTEFWHECVIDNFKEDMEKIGFQVDKVYFSGFSSQGDGACFEGKMIDLRLFLLKHKMGNKFRKFLNYSNDMGISTEHRGHYYHEMCMIVTVSDYALLYSISQERFDSFEEWITETLRDYARGVYKQLEKEYDYLTSAKVIEETIEANDYDFTEDGKLYY